MKRRPIIAGNWKMNKIIVEAIELANGLKRNLYKIENVDIVICPTFTALAEVGEIVLDSNIQLGGQNMYFADTGAFTGEISPIMLKDAGCEYVIIGHSERRAYFGETNEMVNKKVMYAIERGLKPIMCVGEKLEERESGKTFDVVGEHVREGLKGISNEDILEVTIAYEPVWAIGTGKTATPQQAEEVHVFIRNILAELYGKEIGDSIRIQYGGSVTAENIKELISQPNIDGALVGGASLKVDTFTTIVEAASQVKG